MILLITRILIWGNNPRDKETNGLLCPLAPSHLAFVSRLQFFLPIIRRGRTGEPILALTFDDGPDPETTPWLLDLLDRHGVKACFFLVGEKAEKHPGLVAEIVSRGHEVGNHSYSHDTLLMLRSESRLTRELKKCQDVLSGMGIEPLVFRPPASVTNGRLFPVLLRLGLACVCNSVNPRDFGNRRLKGMSRRILRRVRAGDIVLMHDTAPSGARALERWKDEVTRAVAGLQARGLEARRLSEVVRRSVMNVLAPAQGPSQNAVQSFYDGLAPRYDAEIARKTYSSVRKPEWNLATAELKRILHKDSDVLELGVGTGRFTMHMAPTARSIKAIDLSEQMLARLRTKAAEAGRTNIETCRGDIRDVRLEDRYDLICAFSALEYVTGLDEILCRMAGLLKPDGVLLITIARRSTMRFWGQIGNAMRQGFWLNAWSIREMKEMFRSAGLSGVEVVRFGLQGIFSRGVAMMVKGCRIDRKDAA